MRRLMAASGPLGVVIFVDEVAVATQFARGRLCPGAVQGLKHEAGEAAEQRDQRRARRSLARDVARH